MRLGLTVAVIAAGCLALCPQAFSQTLASVCADARYSGTTFCQQAASSETTQATPTNTDANRGQRQPDTVTTPRYVDAAGNHFDRTNASNDPNHFTFAPDPITDFQRLVSSATGEFLPIFGRDLFQQAPSTFAPADEVPITPDYVIGPGDEVLVRLWGADATTTNSQLTVDSSGNIYVPKVGSIQVAGLRLNELQQRISQEVDRNFRNYHIDVTLGHLRSIQIYVVGEARRPGAFTISGLSTVLNALFASGGPSVQGSLRHIQVRRGGQIQTELDLYDLALRGDKSHDIRLQSGDTIFIPAVGPQVAIAGSVRHPAIFELKGAEPGSQANSLEDLLNLAGGLNPTAQNRQVRLERIDAEGQRFASSIALSAGGRATVMRDGDVVFVDHISSGYQNSITLRGNLANPGRFAWHSGMHLSEILPDRSSLLTQDYWRERNSLGVPTPLFEPAQIPTPLGRTPASGANTSGTALANASADSDTQQSASLATGGVISSTNTAGSTTEPSGQGEGTRGNTNAQSVSAASQFDPRGTRIRIPAPEIDWSYAVIERLDPKTLKSSLVPFNLGKLVMDHDSTQDLLLQPGDVVTILSQRDVLVPQAQQTKYVRLEGEFAGAGVYSVLPGETLEQLVQRAGGFTPDAYLYGSSFTRESARIFQQQRLDEYITRLSTDMERSLALRGANGQTDPNALALQRNLIAQLRDLRATGRIVLEFSGDGQSSVAAVPRLPLENGDVFRVPARPNTVSVIGAVYGQNVFLYNDKRHLHDYLSLAGKANRIADKDHAFIIRADGSVYSRERAKGVFSNHFDDSKIFPGDAIVVPEKLIKPGLTRQLLDYSQVLSSFGLAAAAIAVVR